MTGVASGRPGAPPRSARAQELIDTLGLQAHPEGGWYAEVFRSTSAVQPADARPTRTALTCIDFLLCRGEFSAWHRVASDEAWHLLEGDGLRLWLMPPALDTVHALELRPVPPHETTRETIRQTPRHVVPAGWWQAAEPLGDFAYVGATVGPGFDFADFAFGREHAAFSAALARCNDSLQRLL
jgi:uncharacterized protein